MIRPKLIAILLILLTNKACTQTNEPSLLPEISAMQRLKADHNLEDPSARGYIQSLQSRLERGSSTAGRPITARRIEISATKDIYAFSTNSLTLISRGLLVTMANEAELAFVLAHETAHTILQHHAPYLSADDSCSNATHIATSPEIELAADKLAVGIMAAAGYDPRAAIPAITRIYHAAQPPGMTNYPTLKNRVSTVEQAIYNSGWQPPGTNDRREFQKLRQRLASRP